MKKIIIIIILLALGGAGYYLLSNKSSAPQDSMEPEVDIVMEKEAAAPEDSKMMEETSIPDGPTPITIATISGALDDVTNGQDVRGITTNSTTGIATAVMTDQGYQLEAIFENLPAPQGDDFYEGWIVRRGEDFSVFSTGVLELENEATGTYSNIYNSEDTLIDHDFYVLTIEPNDGDPAPADHILKA